MQIAASYRKIAVFVCLSPSETVPLSRTALGGNVDAELGDLAIEGRPAISEGTRRGRTVSTRGGGASRASLSIPQHHWDRGVPLVPAPALRYISNGNYMGTNVSKAAEIRATMDALRCLVQGLRVSARAVEQRHGISGAQLFILHQLAGGEALSVGALAERTFTHQSSVSVVVSRLAKRGLVSRRTGADDARRTDVTLTARGRALLGRAPEVAQARLIAGLQRLRPSERRAVARGLTALVQQVGLRARTPSLFFEDRDVVARYSRRAPQRGSIVRHD
jgi:DNA-binding MarR family transcriptional regulator